MRERAWSKPADIAAKLMNKWSSGFYLSEAVAPSISYPLRFTIAGPKGSALANNYADAREWVKQFTALGQSGAADLEWKEINNQLLGRDKLPSAVLFHSLQQIAQFIRKEKELDRFTEAANTLQQAFPALNSWLRRSPKTVLSIIPDLSRLLEVLEWMVSHPRPELYLRQISLPGIDTKFIEQYKKVLGEWLDILLCSSIVDQSKSGVNNFEARYGFLSKPTLIRFRILDPTLSIQGLTDLSVPAEEFSRLSIEVQRVFVTENDINGLTIPPHEKSIVIFGRGYGFEELAKARWLLSKDIYYWGDIDTHGFAILNQFRCYFPQTRSFLMDRETLVMHRSSWVTEKSPSKSVLSNLTDEETALYNDLLSDALEKSVRLEQEQVRFNRVMAAMKRI